MMQKIRIFVVFLLVLCMSSLLGANSYKPSIAEEYLQQILESYSKNMKEEYGLFCSLKNGTAHEKLEEIHVSFYTYRRASVEEARALQLQAMEKLIQAVNNHQGIQPYLQEHPFTYKRVDISIKFKGPFESYYDGSVTHIWNVTDLAPRTENRNHIFYYTTDPITENNIKLFREHYEEAVKLAHASPVKNPSVHQATELETASERVFNNLGKELAEKNHLYLSSIGGNLTKGIEEIGATFIAFCPATVEKARMFELFIVEKLLNAVNNEPKLRPYLKEYPFPTSRLKICLQFRTKTNFWYTNGSMDNVTMENDVISYFQRPPTNKKEEGPLYAPLFAKETYREAVEALK